MIRMMTGTPVWPKPCGKDCNGLRSLRLQDYIRLKQYPCQPHGANSLCDQFVLSSIGESVGLRYIHVLISMSKSIHTE